MCYIDIVFNGEWNAIKWQALTGRAALTERFALAPKLFQGNFV